MDGNTNESHSLKEKRVVKALRSLDLFLCNAREARSLTGQEDLETAIRILAKYTPEVVIKNGSQGSIGFLDGVLSHVPAIKVKALDTTGAGDCFNAGFLKIWLSGGDQRSALEWGNIVGGLSTTVPGGISRVIRAQEVESVHDSLFKG